MRRLRHAGRAQGYSCTFRGCFGTQTLTPPRRLAAGGEPHHVRQLCWTRNSAASTRLASAMRRQAGVLRSARPLARARSALSGWLTCAPRGSREGGIVRIARASTTAFTAWLQGLAAASDADKVERLVLEALRATVTDGIPTERIDAELHQLQLQARHVCGKISPPPAPPPKKKERKDGLGAADVALLTGVSAPASSDGHVDRLPHGLASSSALPWPRAGSTVRRPPTC